MSSTLHDFVHRPQPAFTWTEVKHEGNVQELRFTSQTWQGREWKHDLMIVWPDHNPRTDHAILVVTGDRVDRVDVPFAKKLCEASHLPVATLFNVPNQPLYDLREDDLISYTFQRYFETESVDWPLLFPMVNSAVKAMDVLSHVHGKWPLKHFVVTGESKRGWTTWLTSALNDPRVLAIAPVAFDFLKFKAQLHHQMEVWGGLSDMLRAYADPAVQSEVDSPAGQHLIQMVDPYAYLHQMKVPVLIVRGTNDPYWPADATSLYWDDIKTKKGMLVLANEGHDFQSDDIYVRTMAVFANHFSELPMGSDAYSEWLDAFGKWPISWVAYASGQDFRASPWHEESHLSLPGPHDSYLGRYQSYQWRQGTLCEPVYVGRAKH
jgi:PhoPQ-activated pathogenicity-related protein